MIHIMIGTKAQFIKMAPIMRELDRRALRFNFIDTGQHAGITGDLIEPFGLREPDIRLRGEKTSIVRLSEALAWAAESLGRVALRADEIRRNVFQGEKGVCLIHGDTLTTLLSLLFARRCGIKVAHVEAGLRSFDLLDPFPEEMIRLIVMRYSDFLFAPSEWACENLKKMHLEGKTIHAGGNTIIDTLRFAASRFSGARPAGSYVVATLHRVETLYSRSRLETVVALLERIGRERRILFILHEPTRQQLIRRGLYAKLENLSSVELMPIQPYLTFLYLLGGADFIVTDGGSIQEESYYLNIPCLVMRAKTERTEGLGVNVFLADFNDGKVGHFLNSFPTLRRSSGSSFENLRPSEVIVDHLIPYA